MQMKGKGIYHAFHISQFVFHYRRNINRKGKSVLIVQSQYKNYKAIHDSILMPCVQVLTEEMKCNPTNQPPIWFTRVEHACFLNKQNEWLEASLSIPIHVTRLELNPKKALLFILFFICAASLFAPFVQRKVSTNKWRKLRVLFFK